MRRAETAVEHREPRGTTAVVMEALEPRLLLAIFPTGYDTYLLELINRGRADPAAEAARYSWDLNEGLAPGTITTAAKQPLAFSDSLIYTAQNHSQWMLDNDLFQHTGEGGSTPNDRMVDAGYSTSGGATGENIGWKGISPTMPVVKTFVEDIHKNLYIDTTEPNRGHRTNQMDPQWHEAGIGVKEGVFTSKGVDWNGVMVTEDLAFGGTRVFLTGVAYADTVLGDQFYTPGEGLENITITATRASDGQVASTKSWPAGAYRIQLAPGTYNIVATGGSLGGTVTYNSVTIGSENVKRDFRPDMVQGNQPPTLTTVTPLTGANQNQDFTLTYDMLAAAANEADPEGATVRFRVESVTTGTLKKGGTAVVPGTTLLGPAESLTWHPAAGASGLLNAFTVKAWDGALASATAVQVQVQVTAAGVPEIAIEQGTVSLVDGDPAPVPFGTVGVGTTAPVIQFKILNLGNATLTLGALTLQSIVGFEVAQAPPATVGAGSWANFSLRMLTAGAGAKSADVVLANNDADENPFNFKVAGTVSAAPPEIEVTQAATILVDGSATPVDFGNVAMRAAAPELEFIINNLGGQTLTLGSVTLDNNQGFSVSKAPATSLAAGASTTLKLRMDTNTAGAKAADVRFSNNDADENPFNFKVAGTVVAQQVALAAADPDASENGPDKGLFVLARTGPTTAPLTVSYTVSGTAVNGTDYQRLSGQATFAADSWVLLLDVTPVDDALVENPETVIVTLVDGTWLGYTLDAANKTGTVTITDNEPTVALVVQDATASENPGDKGTFRITRSNVNLTMPLDVRYTMTGTAINGTDYHLLSGTATIPAGAAFVDVEVDPYDDASVEAAETAILTLQSSTAYTLDAANKTGTVTITDNEPTVALVVQDAAASENAGDKGTFRITRSNVNLTMPLDVRYTMTGTALNGTDYVRLAGTATIPAGAAFVDVDIDAYDDASVEAAETAIMTLQTSTAYALDAANKTGTVTIADNEPTVALVVQDATASENAGDKGTFRITRSNVNLTMPLAVPYVMTGTAINGTDYVRLSGTATIPAGAASVDVDITAYDDASVEPAETAIMTLQTSTAYTLNAANKTGTVTIADNEPAVALVVQDATASENAGDKGTFRITRSNVNPATALNVPYVMTGTAINGGDYHRLWGAATIPAGAAFVDVDIDVWEDSYVEPAETAILTIQTSTAYALDPANKTGTVTIADNEPVVGIVATDPNASEQGPHAAVFTITRSNVGAQDLMVRVNRSGTASYPGDVLDWSYPVIPAGQTSTTLAITPIDDRVIEPAETFILTIDNSYVACGYSVDPAQTTATATIADNEPTVGIVATDGNMAEEGQDPGQFTITRSNVGAQDLTVSYTVGGTAVNGGDYYWAGWTWASGFPSTIGGVVTIPAGSTSVAIDLVPYDDLFVEGIQTVILTLKDASTYIVSALNNSATATLLDNEPTVGVAAQDAAASEDGPDKGVFRISRSNVGAADLTVLYDLAGTAQWNTDYTMPRGQAVIPAGATYVDVDVTPVNDSLIEPAETAILTLRRSQVTEAFPALRVNYGGPAVDTYAIDDANKSATVTVADFEPTVSLAATDAAAAEATPANTGTFTFSLDKAGATDLTIRYTVTGTAMNGSDYNPWPNMLTGSLLIPAGATTATITITPVDDTLAEPAETVILTLTPGSTSYYIDGAQTTATVTILDNEPVLSATAPDALAAEQGADPAQFLITLNKPATAPLTVRYTMTGTATNGTDYNTLNGTLTIPAGSTTATLDVVPKDDFLAEPDETVILTLATSTAYTLAPGQGSATATIDDNEPSVGITATVAAASEQGPAAGTFQVTRNAAAATPLTVNFTVGGTASTSGDYAPIGTSVVIPANQTAALITVTPIDDTLAEGNETVIVTLQGNPAFSVDPAAASATVTIADNEAMVDVIAQDPNASEDPGNPGAFRVRRSNVGATDLAVRYTMGGTASASGDYAALSGTATIPAGATFVDVTLQPIDDVLPEGNETAILTLTPAAAYSVNPAAKAATVTIADNEPIVSIAAFDANAAENGGDKGILRISRNNIGAADLAIRYTTSGTASPGSDYAALGGTAVIPAGAGFVDVDILPMNDFLTENAETAILTLAAGTGYSIDPAANADTVTIADGATVLVSASAPDPTAAEIGNNTGTLRLMRSTIGSADMPVRYTMSGTATNGTDYENLGGTATIPAGATFVDINILPLSDLLTEGDETAILTLLGGTNYLAAPGQTSATVTIVDGAPPTVSITATDAVASETAGNPGTFRFSRSTLGSAPLEVRYTLSGTASTSGDYQTLNGKAIIPAGALWVDVNVVPIDDPLPEPDETVIATLSSSTAYTLNAAQKSATVTIQDNEPVVSIAALDPAASEQGPDKGTFRITRSVASALPLTVNFAVSGTASSGSDYVSIGWGATILANQTYVDVDVLPVDDTLAEPAETVIVTLSPGSTFTLDAGAKQATVTIADNEPVVSVTPFDAAAGETAPDNGWFQITRSNVGGQALTVRYAMTGTAANGTDYTTLTGQAVIAAGDTTVYVAVAPIDDTLAEGPETAILTLQSSTAYTVNPAANTATVTIADNEPVVSITAPDATASEPGANTGTFTLTRSIVSASPLTVNFTVGGTATSGADYNSFGGSATIPANQAAVNITVTPKDDTIIEVGNETVVVTLSPSSTFSLDPAAKTATVTILDNEVWPDAFENDDGYGGAKPLVPDVLQNRTVHEATNLDWISFTVDLSHTYYWFDVTVPAGSALRMSLYGGNYFSAPMFGWEGLWMAGGTTTTHWFQPVSTGTYYLKFHEAAKTSTVPWYTVKLRET